MTAEVQAVAASEQKLSDKELNFRALEAKYERRLEEIQRENEEVKRIAQEALEKYKKDDDDDSELVDNKNLEKKLAKFGENTKKQTHAEIQQAVHAALEEERKNAWIETNNDFYDVMQHAEKLPGISPELAKTILKMPEGFERQKLVYANIKALGLHKPAEKATSIQDKVDANRRSPYYQPSGIASAPYAAAEDFSDAGKKNAYAKMQELKNRLRVK
jgi:hypothetical protein